MILLTGMAQQRVPSKISFRDAQGTVQRGPAAWEACPTTSIFSQSPNMPNDPFSAFTIDSFFPYLVHENYTGVTQPIGIVHFWGLNLIYNSGFFDCSGEDPMGFEIKFYQDNAGLSGAVVYSEILTILRDVAGLSYARYPLYHYKAVLSNPVNLPGGWISIQGVSTGSPENCVFLWMSSPIGDENAYQFSPPNMNQISYDLSLCFEAGTTSEVPLAPWALIFGVALIAGSIFLRYRRIL